MSNAKRPPVILVIDDDPNNMDVVSNYLAECDYTILVAEDGESGLARAAYAKPDLILLDVMMPGIDGMETCRRLKATDETRAIPVIFMTALAETEHKVKGFSVGAVDYITKPFQREEVLARVGVHLRIRELTDRLQETNDSLEKKVEERTSELAETISALHDEIMERKQAEEELRNAQKMEAIGTLAGGIAHDFNNILTGIIGFTSLAQMKLDDRDALTRNLERVLEASQRAKELVARILTFCRQNSQPVQPVRLAAIVNEVLHLLRSTIPTTIEIDKSIADDAAESMVMADPVQIHQVLMNLATNAAHAMRQQGGNLCVSLANHDADNELATRYPDMKPGPYIHLTVRDTGHGMDKNTLERIFDPYFTTKKIGEGTGMGLAVVQGIINNLGGAIRADSEPGVGTTFHIMLPVSTAGETLPIQAEELPTGGAERVLFVDDEEIVTELGRMLLESLGYDVTVTSSSTQALELFRATPDAFDLVITDMTMPGLTGKDLARELLALRPDLPIVICTGYSNLINEQQAKECGIKGYLMKPYDTGSLDKAIRQVLAANLA